MKYRIQDFQEVQFLLKTYTTVNVVKVSLLKYNMIFEPTTITLQYSMN